MSLQVDIRPTIDRDLQASGHFGDTQYLQAALIVANRIRKDLKLDEADHLMPGYVDDTRWGNPVVFTATAGEPLAVAHFEAEDNRIVVDSLDAKRQYPLTRGSVVGEFIRRFNAGAYPGLNARKAI